MGEIKQVLIISPYFPPSNAADMQRVRISLPFFQKFGWEAEVVIVSPKFSDTVKDDLLKESVPSDIKVHQVNAFSKRLTSKFGLGSIALRSLYFYFTNVNKILKEKRFDLIYFSTTQFPVCILGPIWKKKFNIPYIIDMQDPWHSTYYFDKPKKERPPKYWFSYRLNKFLEPLAMRNVDGIISVSNAYIELLRTRYEYVKTIPATTITFGYLSKDFEIAKRHTDDIRSIYQKKAGILNVVYVGRGGFDMQLSIRLLFQAFASLLEENQSLFSKLRFHFIGTSYASEGKGIPTVAPVAEEFGISYFVNEITDRIAYYENIKSLQNADALFIPGSNDKGYTASKIYPYIVAEKPLLAVFSSASSSYEIIKRAGGRTVADLNSTKAVDTIKSFLNHIVLNSPFKPETNWKNLEEFSAESLTQRQCKFFDEVLNNRS